MKIQPSAISSKYTNNYYTIKKYNDNYYRFIIFKRNYKTPGYEEEIREYVSALEIIEELETKNNNNYGKLINNIIRAKSTVFEYSICNEFDYFITLTLDKNKLDRYDLDNYIKKLGQWMRDYRKKYKTDIQYILIPEKHKDGAWHMHGLIKGIHESDIEKNKNGYLDWISYSKKFGYCSLGEIKDKIKVSKYITKYITKGLKNTVQEKNKKLYYCTRGLKKSEKIAEGLLPPGFEWNLKFENEYVKMEDMTESEIKIMQIILKEGK